MTQRNLSERVERHMANSRAAAEDGTLPRNFWPGNCSKCADMWCRFNTTAENQLPSHVRPEGFASLRLYTCEESASENPDEDPTPPDPAVASALDIPPANTKLAAFFIF